MTTKSAASRLLYNLWKRDKGNPGLTEALVAALGPDCSDTDRVQRLQVVAEQGPVQLPAAVRTSLLNDPAPAVRAAVWARGDSDLADVEHMVRTEPSRVVKAAALHYKALSETGVGLAAAGAGTTKTAARLVLTYADRLPVDAVLDAMHTLNDFGDYHLSLRAARHDHVAQYLTNPQNPAWRRGSGRDLGAELLLTACANTSVRVDQVVDALNEFLTGLGSFQTSRGAAMWPLLTAVTQRPDATAELFATAAGWATWLNRSGSRDTHYSFEVALWRELERAARADHAEDPEEGPSTEFISRLGSLGLSEAKTSAAWNMLPECLRTPEVARALLGTSDCDLFVELLPYTGLSTEDELRENLLDYVGNQSKWPEWVTLYPGLAFEGLTSRLSRGELTRFNAEELLEHLSTEQAEAAGTRLCRQVTEENLSGDVWEVLIAHFPVTVPMLLASPAEYVLSRIAESWFPHELVSPLILELVAAAGCTPATGVRLLEVLLAETGGMTFGDLLASGAAAVSCMVA